MGKFGRARVLPLLSGYEYAARIYRDISFVDPAAGVGTGRQSLSGRGERSAGRPCFAARNGMTKSGQGDHSHRARNHDTRGQDGLRRDS